MAKRMNEIQSVNAALKEQVKNQQSIIEGQQ